MGDLIIHFHKYSANIKVNKHISGSGRYRLHQYCLLGSKNWRL